MEGGREEAYLVFSHAHLLGSGRPCLLRCSAHHPPVVVRLQEGGREEGREGGREGGRKGGREGRKDE